MPILLRHSRSVSSGEDFESWFAIGAIKVDLPLARKVGGLALALEKAFDDISDDWFELALRQGLNPTSIYAHAPSCTANVSDLGVMMAWAKIVDGFAARSETTLIVCDDPWVYRHLSQKENITSGPPPTLGWTSFVLATRGLLSRLRCALRLARERSRVSDHKENFISESNSLLVYGHPRSTAEGHDGYFGNLLKELPQARRVLHVDCLSERANTLKGAGQTASLHAWSQFADLLGLPFVRWRPALAETPDEWRWLVKRAVALEGGTGQAAMIRWQQICQRRWLQSAKPECVIWPWENHGWERDFVRAARAAGVRTVGYQHSVIGPQMLNYSFQSNADGLASIPDVILCTGKATLEQLSQWGIPKERLHIGGALRIPDVKKMTPTATGPVYMALSFDQETAKQMVAAAELLTMHGYKILLKSHPMQPTILTENKNIEVTQKFFSDFDNLKAVIYAASTVGMEAAIAGLPTIRYQTEGKIALDILPPSVSLPASDFGGLVNALENATPVAVTREDVFSPVNRDVWKKAIARD